MNQPKMIKQLLISSTVLGSLLMVGVTQAKANEGQTETASTATTESTTDSTSTSGSSVTLQSSTERTTKVSTESNPATKATETDADQTTVGEQPQSEQPNNAINPVVSQKSDEQLPAPDQVTAPVVQSRMTTFKAVKSDVSASVVKADIDLTAQEPEIQAGESANFNLKLSVSGIN